VPYRLGVIGDTQGRYSVEDLLARVEPAFAEVDEIWHAGDWQHPEVLEGLQRLKPLTVVNGNAPDDPRYPERVVREIDGLRIGMVHRPPSPGEDWLRGIGVCIHGHTHRWRDEVVGAVRFINVSTATGAWFSRDRSAGIMTIDRGLVALDKVDLG
jgi:predicted phosphodiesterase